MRIKKMLVLFLAMVVHVGLAAADVKVTQKHHQDGFTMMGQTQPETDEVHTTWIGDKRLRIDQGSTSTIVDSEAGTMTIVEHGEKSYTEIDIPVDLNALLPPGMGEQMMAMMKLDVAVTPTDETAKIGQWNARKYLLKVTSAMMNMESEIWATTETSVDLDRYFELYSNVMSLQPGMDAMLAELKKIDGYVVAQNATMTMSFMGDTSIGSSDEVVSIETIDAPTGTYTVPADYTKKEFNYMEMMQGR